MTTFSGDVARFNATASGNKDSREAERLAADPAVRAFRVEAHTVPTELAEATPAYLALLDQVEFTPAGTFLPGVAPEAPEVD